MSFTVGIGALLDTKTSNTVRFLELTAADATKNFDGLAQPPHITVKRPFSVASLEDIEKLQALLEGLAQKTPAFNVHYSGMGSFGNSTLFLAVQSSKDLQHLHQELLAALRSSFEASEAPFEGPEMVFHTSLAVNLREQQLQLARESIESNPTEMACSIRRLGIFLGLNNNTHWVIISEVELSQ